jgi:stage V sporulation protein D (sporulation-specific penicillin-binding protein)
VANGGYLVTPHLLSTVTDTEGNVIKSYDTNVRRQVVSSDICKTVSTILEGGVSGNGGAKNAYVAGYRIAAKTGTSEKKNEGAIGKYICSTVAYAPADDPQYACLIIVDEPSRGVLYGSVVAAPYVAKVMERILPYLGVEAIYSEDELDRMTVTAPSCVGWSGSYAKRTYGEKMNVIVIGDENDVVYKQYPEKDTVMEKGSATLILYTGKNPEVETVKVPDLVGMSAKAANQTLVNAGLNVRITGTKNYTTGSTVTVISQSVAPGTEVPKGTVVEVYFLSLEDEDMGGVTETG